MDFVKIYTRVWSGDIRFARLLRMGLGDRRAVMGSLVFVWGAVAQTEDDVLSRDDIDQMAEVAGFGDALVLVGLAEPLTDGLVRVRGARDELARIHAKRDQSRAAVASRWAAERKTDTSSIRPNSDRNTPVSPSGYRVEESRVEESRVEESRVEESRGDLAAGASTQPAGSRKRGSSVAPSDEATQVAAWLLDAIRSHQPVHQARANELAGWAREIDLAIRVDGASPSDLRLAIDCAHRNHADTFWRANLLSGKSLRKHWRALVIKASLSRQVRKASGLSAGDLRDITERLQESDRAEQGRLRIAGPAKPGE